MNKTFKFTEKERFLIFHLIENEQDEGTFTLIDRIEQIISERITPEQDTIKPYHEHGNSVASDRTESGQSAEEKALSALSFVRTYQTNNQIDWLKIYEDVVAGIVLHYASQVCADKDREISLLKKELDRAKEEIEKSHMDKIYSIHDLKSELSAANESLTVMVRKNAELLESVRPEVVVPSEERMNDLAQAFDELPKTKESKDTWECAAFKKGSRMTLSELRRLNPAMTFTELNHTAPTGDKSDEG